MTTLNDEHDPSGQSLVEPLVTDRIDHPVDVTGFVRVRQKRLRGDLAGSCSKVSSDSHDGVST